MLRGRRPFPRVCKPPLLVEEKAVLCVGVRPRILRRVVVSLCIFFSFSLSGVAQINTDQTMIMGRNSLFFEDYLLSIQYFNRVIEAKPYLAQPYFFRGLAKFRLDDYSGSVRDCSEAIERNPFLTDAYQVRAIGYIRLEQYEKAVQDYLYVLSVNPRETNALYNTSLCYMHLKEFQKAEEMLTQLERFSTTEKPRIWLMKADCALEQNDTIQALRLADQSLELDSLQGDAYAFKASIYLKQENWPQAELDLTKALQNATRRSAELYITRALVRYYQWKLDEALADYDEAILIYPSHLIARYNRGLLRMNVGDDNRAIEDFDFVLEKQPDNEQALVNRGILRLQTGDYRGAIRDFSTVIAAHPNFLVGYQYRAEAYRKAGMATEASRDEMKLLRANMDMRFGGNSWRAQVASKPARKITDEDVENYNQVVESDEEEETMEYKSPFRGKIQNRKTEMKPEPLFHLSYYKEYEEVPQGFTFYKPLEDLNLKKVFPQRLLISNQENTLSEELIATRFASIGALSKEITLAPDHALLYLARALDYSLTQDLQAALTDLERAIQCDSTLMWSYFARAEIRWKLYQLEQGELQEPSPAYSSETPSASVKSGSSKSLALQLILQDLNRTVQQAPDFAFAYYNQAFLLAQLGRKDEAIASYTKAISLEPTLAAAYFNRGLLHIANDQQKEGLSDLSRAGEMGIAAAYSLIKRFNN